MTQKQYLKELKRNLSKLNKTDRDEIIAFYKESIADRTESGISEEAAVSELESPEAVAERCLKECAVGVNGDNAANKHGNSVGLKIALFIVGFPLWVTLVAIVFSLIVALIAVAVGLTVGGVGFIGYGIYYMFQSVAEGLFATGLGIAAVPLGIFTGFGTVKLIAVIKKLFKTKKVKEKV